MARFDVYISGDGLAEIDGTTLVPEPGESVHEAVLDRLEGHARERGGAVVATVYDSPGAARFLLEVLPDGSSRVLDPDEEPQPESTTVEPESTTAGPESAPPAPAVVPSTVVVPAPSPEGASAVATAVARARATAAARADLPDPAAVAAPVVTTALPADLTERIARVNALAADARLDEAFADASELRESLTDALGAEHPYAVEARAVEAYLAHLRGDHREAIVLALAVARIRCGARDGRAPAEVARAAAAWQQLDDDRAVVAHGRELLHMWAMLDRNGLLPPGYAALIGQVRRQVDDLEAYV
ncbi:hypothetical protein ACFYXJ_28440 [Streptomyces sp. NPDC002667]|uniref:hypothetical protein n=1 Tax=Streptomyces sp. NPDC002667 TaxID=3364657 RepID=UPI0036CD9D65